METRYSRSPLLDITSALEYVGQSAFGQLQFFPDWSRGGHETHYIKREGCVFRFVPLGELTLQTVLLVVRRTREVAIPPCPMRLPESLYSMR